MFEPKVVASSLSTDKVAFRRYTCYITCFHYLFGYLLQLQSTFLWPIVFIFKGPCLSDHQSRFSIHLSILHLATTTDLKRFFLASSRAHTRSTRTFLFFTFGTTHLALRLLLVFGSPGQVFLIQKKERKVSSLYTCASFGPLASLPHKLVAAINPITNHHSLLANVHTRNCGAVFTKTQVVLLNF